MNRKKEYGWGSLVALAGSVVIIYYSCTSCRSDAERYAWSVLFSMITWMTVWIVNAELNEYLDKKISWIKQPLKRFLVGLAGTVVFTVLVSVLLLEAWQLIWDFRFSNYRPIVINSLVITFFISLFFHGRGFLMEWRQSAIDAERYQKESMTATYENLKSQVNPHFLFNSLNALTNLVYEDQAKAVKFIKQLSEVYRYVLDTRDKEVVALSEELKFLESYNYLQQIRFGEKLKIQIDIKNADTKVAPLALQMLMENAIKHNEVSEEYPLQIRVEDDAQYVSLTNTLQKKKTLGDSSSGLGLENIQRRYQFLSNLPVQIINGPELFTVKLPRL